MGAAGGGGRMMRHPRACWPAAIAGVAVALLLALAPVASARKFQMSGSSALRRGTYLFFPFQFYVPPNPTITPRPPFPNGPVLGKGGVVATGSAPATLVIPSHRFRGAFSALVPWQAPPTAVQLTTMLVADAPATQATLAPGAGPGSFTWCPGDPACVVGSGMLSTDPPQGAGPRNGRVIYRAGSNQFGGVMRMLLQGGGSNSFRVNTSPFQAGHFRFGFVTGAADGGLQHTGGPYATTVMDTHPWALNVVTQPLVAPMPGNPITAPGPTVPVGTSVWCPGTGSEPGCTLISTHTGFPFTTGTVIAQQTTGSGGADFFTVMGSDVRTVLGAGNIALVAGGLSLRRWAGSSSLLGSFASYGRVRMTLSAPIPSLSPAGLAAATALLLLAAGYALRRMEHRVRSRLDGRSGDNGVCD